MRSLERAPPRRSARAGSSCATRVSFGRTWTGFANPTRVAAEPRRRPPPARAILRCRARRAARRLRLDSSAPIAILDGRRGARLRRAQPRHDPSPGARAAEEHRYCPGRTSSRRRRRSASPATCHRDREIHGTDTPGLERAVDPDGAVDDAVLVGVANAPYAAFATPPRRRPCAARAGSARSSRARRNEGPARPPSVVGSPGAAHRAPRAGADEAGRGRPAASGGLHRGREPRGARPGGAPPTWVLSGSPARDDAAALLRGRVELRRADRALSAPGRTRSPRRPRPPVLSCSLPMLPAARPPP